ncbi:MAG: PfkB family carbohydrate kinase [Chloroflexota bacterium]
MAGTRETARGRVVVVGSVNADLIVRVAHLPRPGETVVGGTFERHGGGKGANQAVAAARAGASVRFIGAVGDDDDGRAAAADLAAEGIDTSGVAVLADAPTGIALIVVGPTGENQIAVASGANGRLDADMVDSALAADPLRPGDVCLVGFEVPASAVLAAAIAARAVGATVIVNPAPARAMDRGLEALGPILTPNRGEATTLTRMDDPLDAAHALVARTASPVIVTLGSDGALLVAPGREVERLPAHRVEPIDTTGAGDAFNGTLAAELAHGRSLREAAETAMVMAALTTLAVGARAMPRAGGDTRAALARAALARTGSR